MIPSRIVARNWLWSRSNAAPWSSFAQLPDGFHSNLGLGRSLLRRLPPLLVDNCWLSACFTSPGLQQVDARFSILFASCLMRKGNNATRCCVAAAFNSWNSPPNLITPNWLQIKGRRAKIYRPFDFRGAPVVHLTGVMWLHPALLSFPKWLVDRPMWESNDRFALILWIMQTSFPSPQKCTGLLCSPVISIVKWPISNANAIYRSGSAPIPFQSSAAVE